MNRVITNSVNRITKHFGGSHKGVDLGWSGNENDNYVHANCKGIVAEIVDGKNRNILASGASSWGNYVLIKHPNGMYTRYAHLIKYTIPVKVGQEVDENTMVGVMGTSGVTYGRHLHFEVAKGYSSTTRINPEPYLTKPVCDENIKEENYYLVFDNIKNKWLPNITIGSNDYAGNNGNGISGLKITNLTYRVHDKRKNKWLPWVIGLNDYAGNLTNDIDGVQIGNATYQVRVNGEWLNWVTGWNNTSNGYAGIYGKTITGIRIK